MNSLSFRGYLKWLPDELFLKIIFRLKMGYRLDLNNPNIITLKSKETIKLAKKYSWEKQLSFFDKVYDMAIINFERKNGKTKDKI